MPGRITTWALCSQMQLSYPVQVIRGGFAGGRSAFTQVFDRVPVGKDGICANWVTKGITPWQHSGK
ncbi:hypothetical protein GCM10010971_21970 [Silvimonas amylolytica]|uniref:Uncharacterized protein n=1 Tax=Silvimonas amylolytica TaxID=449663 RepID=A0ABQ2PM23_9NEIS|nr:hypothetical protein GCM10010971_21970 [Silvimonas amylolytica]